MIENSYPPYGREIRQQRDPLTGGYLDLVEAKVRLALFYNAEQVLVSDPFTLHLFSDVNGYQAERLAGFRIEDRLALLDDPSLPVVESVVLSLRAIGGAEALAALKKLRQKNLVYLKKNFSKTCGEDCPESPDEVYESFLRVLDKSIEEIEVRSLAQQ